MEALVPILAVFAVILLSARLSSRNTRRGQTAARPQPVRPAPARPAPVRPVCTVPVYEARPSAVPFESADPKREPAPFTEGTDPCHDDMSSFTEGTDPCHDDMSSFTEGTDPCHDDMSSFTEGTDPCHDGLYQSEPVRSEESSSPVLPDCRSQQLLQGVVLGEILQRRPIRAYRPIKK